jgi:hypothetical protein
VSTLGLLLRDNLLVRNRVLGLLSTLLALLLLLLILGVLDSLGTSGLTDLGADRALLLDHLKRSTNNGTLVLDGAAGALLGDLLSNTLAVMATVENSPRNTTGVLALLEKRLRLGRLESEDLGVTTDEKAALLLVI